MSNLPLGAENDPYAPWNQKDKLCRYCDKEEIQEQLFRIIALDSTLDEDRVDEVIDEELDKFSLCPQCAKEEYYDYDEED